MDLHLNKTFLCHRQISKQALLGLLEDMGKTKFYRQVMSKYKQNEQDTCSVPMTPWEDLKAASSDETLWHDLWDHAEKSVIFQNWLDAQVVMLEYLYCYPFILYQLCSNHLNDSMNI